MPEPEINYFAHLGELRNYVMVMVVTLCVSTLVSFYFSEVLVNFVTNPMKKSISELYFLSPYEAFFVRLRVSVASGVILSSPIVFALIWAFVAPGLYLKEKKVVFPLSLISIGLFYLGILFAHFLVIPFALNFFLGFQTESLKPLISIGSYTSLYLTFVLIFGGIFVTPVMLTGLMYYGVLNASALKKQRKVVLVLVFILAAVLTPTMDILTQCLMAIPLWLLFEVSVWIGARFEKRRECEKEHAAK
jgi:sec-independent protein translocase protein TatC